jgi:hypothetical protein
MASGATLTTTQPISPSHTEPSTPALTPGVTADDSDTDFQSAYSDSPRGSCVYSGDDVEMPLPEDIPDMEKDFSKTPEELPDRERTTSTATAVIAKLEQEPVVSRNRTARRA